MKLDPKVIFYLKHQNQIEEWIGLKARASTEADRFFRSLAPDVTQLTQSLGTDVKPFISLDEAAPKLFLHRTRWLADGGEWPRIAIGLEWRISKADFRGSWAGVWVHKELDKGNPLHAAVLKEMAKFPGSMDGFKSEPWWPVWRYEEPEDPEYWNNLMGYGHLLVKRIGEHWSRFEAIVERAIKAVP